MNLLETVIKQLLFEARITTQIKSFKMPKDFPMLEALWAKTGIKALDFVPANQKRNDLTPQQIKDLAESIWFQKYDGFRVQMKGVNADLTAEEQQKELFAYLGSITGGTMYKEKMGPGFAVIVSINQNARSVNQSKTLMFPVYDFLVFYADKTLPLKISTPKIATLSSGADVYSYEDIMGIPIPVEDMPKTKIKPTVTSSAIGVDRLKQSTNADIPVLNKLFLPWYLNSQAAEDYYKKTADIYPSQIFEAIKTESSRSCELIKCIMGFQDEYGLVVTGEFDDATKNFILSHSGEWKINSEEDSRLVAIVLPEISNKAARRITRQISDCNRDFSTIQQQSVNVDNNTADDKKIDVASITVPAGGYKAGDVMDDTNFYEIQKLMLQVFEKMNATSQPVYINLKTALQNTANQGDYYKAGRNQLGATQKAVVALKSALEQIYPNLVTDIDANKVDQWFVQVLTDFILQNN